MKKRILTIYFIVVMSALISWSDWPQFRGPNNDGHAVLQAGEQAKPLPVEFNESTNVKWKIPIHDLGWCTPVIMGKQVWLTTASLDGRKMYVLCIDRESGEILLDRQQFNIESPRPLGNDVNTYASPSCVIEEGRVYVHFGSYGTACIDTKTFKTLWQRQDLPCNHFRGPASSPILFEDKLILTFDGSDYQYQAALNKITGETIWKTDRDSNFKDLDNEGKPKRDGDLRKAYCTPYIAMIDNQPQMLVAASHTSFCYDPRSGEEIWRIDHEGYSIASMSLYGHGLIYIFTGRSRPDLLAVQPGGKGDITKTHIKWKYNKGVPSMCSPIMVGDLIYFVNNGGVITCLDAKTGEEVWKDRLKGQYYASPIFADNKLYFCNVTGDVTIIKPGRKMNILKINTLSDGFMSSPAAINGELYLRTKSHLYRIEQIGS